MSQLIRQSSPTNSKLRLRRSQWLGLVDYREALSLQHRYELEVQASDCDQILGLEHPYVVTLGKRSKFDSEIPVGDHVVWVDRGGEATLHSPGQLVIYPIVNLADRFGVREWVEFLLDVTEQTLLRFGVVTERGEHSGLWTANGKIAFAGIRVRNRVSTHGLSINVCNDLRLFEPMKSCGVRRAQMDSIEKFDKTVQPADVFEVWFQVYEERLSGAFAEKPLLESDRLDSFRGSF